MDNIFVHIYVQPYEYMCADCGNKEPKSAVRKKNDIIEHNEYKGVCYLLFFFFRFFANLFSAFVIGLFAPTLVENSQFVGAATQCCTADTLLFTVESRFSRGMETYYIRYTLRL